MANIESLLRFKPATPTESYSSQATSFEEKFVEEMDDDINTQGGLATLFEFVNYLNTILNKANSKEEIRNQLAKDYELFLDQMLQLRQEARKNKNFQFADEIRDKILAQGYKVEDKPWGSHAIRLPKKLESLLKN